MPEVQHTTQNQYTLNELMDQAVSKMRPLRRRVLSVRLRNKAYRDQALAELHLKLAEDSRASTLGIGALTDDAFNPMTSKIQLDPDKLKQILDLILEYLPKILDLIMGLFGVVAFLILTFAPSIAMAQCQPGMACWNQRQVRYTQPQTYVQPTYTQPQTVMYTQPTYVVPQVPTAAPVQVPKAPTQVTYINFMGCDNCGSATPTGCPCGMPGCNCAPAAPTVAYTPPTISYGSTGSSVTSYGSTGSSASIFLAPVQPYASYGSTGAATVAVQSGGSSGSYGSYGGGVYGQYNTVARTVTTPRRSFSTVYDSGSYHSNGSGQSLADHLSTTHGIDAYGMSPEEQEAAHVAAHANGGGFLASGRRFRPVRNLLGL